MIWLSAVVVAAAATMYVVYFRWFTRWLAAQTHGMAYFGRSPGERAALQARIRRYSRPVAPVVSMLAGANHARLTMPSFEVRGVAGPPGVSSPEVFEQASRYQPTAADLFVVTQMRCGTTWMQQIVYQLVTRGAGELGQPGFEHLYALSPWIDATTTVSMEAAPLVGSPRTRIIKSHLPADLAPYSPDAKYVYVTRHPVACFASIVDYNRTLLGPLTPPIETLAAWYCGPGMYWRPWPQHVAGWWEWAERHSNVLFVHYEELVRDFAGVLARLERLVGVELTADERRDVTRKCSFEYMKAHEILFEMAPPTMFSVNGGKYLNAGQARRQEDVNSAIAESITTYCRAELRGRSYPAATFYPELAG